MKEWQEQFQKEIDKYAETVDNDIICNTIMYKTGLRGEKKYVYRAHIMEFWNIVKEWAEDEALSDIFDTWDEFIAGIGSRLGEIVCEHVYNKRLDFIDNKRFDLFDDIQDWFWGPFWNEIRSL